MKTSEQLRAAKALIDTPDKWYQGDFGMTVKGDEITETSLAYGLPDDQIYCMCAETALMRVIGENWTDVKATELIRVHCGMNFIAEAQDDPSTIHSDVMNWFDRAIAQAESEGD